MIQDWLKRLRIYWNASQRNQVIVAASATVVVALLIVGISALAGRGNASPGTIAQATATPVQKTATPAGTPHPTPKAGATATPLPTKPVTQAIVGGVEAGFTKIYGKPIGTGVDSGNNLPTIDYKGSGPVGGITIELDSTRSFVLGVVVSAQQNSPWDAVSVNAICPHFAPTDASYDPAQSITNGSNEDVALFQLGHSALLGNTLPESVFTDNQGQPVLSGTFSTQIYYIQGTNGRLAYACSLRLGNQPTSPGA